MSKKKNEAPPKTNVREVMKLMFIVILTITAIVFGVSFGSYVFTWEGDQSVLYQLTDRSQETQNLMSRMGIFLGDFFMYRGVGIAAFILVGLLIITTSVLFFNGKRKLLNDWFHWTLIMLYLSLCFGFFTNEASILGGKIGYECNQFLQDYIGVFGTALLLLTIAGLYAIHHFHITTEQARETFIATSEKMKNPRDLFKPKPAKATPPPASVVQEPEEEFVVPTPKEEKIEVYTHRRDIPPLEVEVTPPVQEEPEQENFEVEMKKEAQIDPKQIAKKLVEDFGEYDPTLELKDYLFPPIELLKEYNNSTLVRDDEELNENKDTIIQTLKEYGITISKISAVIGPTVTLYEIVPAAGIRISKIKSLEDDIALKLAALGIRIIAPIPGKGTIGIEVPNKKASVVSMRSVLTSQRFQTSEMDLPIAFGKTITNETFVVDLAKMPHLLMAGATGQGKSVGLNAVLASLLYKKHPAEVKFVLVDPKKVELTLYNKIERHYLAKLPDSEEAIITDNTKVINTLNSLCIEMDNRYELLKNAMVRNIREYNEKFKARLLNPNEGHQFLPYIILVVDEFADLIMTAGKEVELPIARLAQLARAIGIHLIVATQRPSVNVITGTIKANFPARVAFKVSSKVDSKTILDGSGADRLIGRGDMLYTQGNDLIRIQCAFIDTPEVERVVEFIGSQRGYPDAHLLPEYVGEGGGEVADIDISERDPLFREAAEIVVSTQQGSASTLQRKLKLGYNRAGRLIDQLEAAGIVGPFKGSKAREVLIPDIIALEQYFNRE